jgi:hypothetical protein
VWDGVVDGCGLWMDVVCGWMWMDVDRTPPSIFTLCASPVKSYGCRPRVLHRRSNSSVAPPLGGGPPP